MRVIPRWIDSPYADNKETTEAYCDAIKNGGTTYIKILIGDVILENDDIDMNGGVTITTHLNPEQDLTYGTAASTELVMHLIKSEKTESIDWTNTVYVSMGIYLYDRIVYTTIGYFSGETPKTISSSGTDIIVFTGYDPMIMYNKIADDFIQELQFPSSMRQIINGIATKFNVVISLGQMTPSIADTVIQSNPFPRGCTYRSILSWMAEATGTYIVQTGGNTNSSFRRYLVPSLNIEYELTPDNYYNLEKSDVNVPSVVAVVAVDTNNELNTTSYPSTYTGVAYQIVDNPILNSFSEEDKLFTLSVIKDRLTFDNTSVYNLKYVPMNVSAIGNWLVEAGDIIDIVDMEGNTVPMRIFSRVLHWNGGCTDYYECTGNTERKELSEYQIGQYQLSGKLSGKYDVVSGVEITEAGVTISGGSYLKLISGGVLDVDASNFEVSSTDKYFRTGKWKITTSGMSRKDSETIGEQTVDESFNIGFKVLPASDYSPSGTECKTHFNYYTYGAEESGNDILYNSFMFYATENPFTGNYQQISLQFTENPSGYDFMMVGDGREGNRFIIGSAEKPIDYGYFAKLSGDAVKNNLTTTTAGYVLDARQGKTLNDTKVHYTNAYSSDMNTLPITAKPYMGVWTTSTSASVQTAHAPSFSNFGAYGVYWGYGSSEGYQTQIAMDNTGGVAVRGKYNGTWEGWGRLPTVHVKNVAASGSTTINLSNNGRYMITCIGASTNCQTIYLVNVTSAGSVSYKTMATASSLTVTIGTRTFTIANSNSSSAVNVFITAYLGTVS